MVDRKFCDVCGEEIPPIPDSFTIHDMNKFGSVGTFRETNLMADTFSADLCYICSNKVKGFILENQSLQGKAIE